LGAVDRITKTIKAYPGVFHGIGEVMSRHDDLTNLIEGERPSADHPALRRVYDFAGLHRMPISIHHNIAPISPSGAYSKPLYLPELLICFDEHPKTTFIWCHAGVSRRIQVKELPEILDSVLARHKSHVYIDLSWVVLDDYALKDPETWGALIRKYPENFLVGSDIVGSLRAYVGIIRAYDKLFTVIGDESVTAKIARDNFLRVMRPEGVTISSDYQYPEHKYVPRAAP
jgi:predicted TIM-barrel fold metal-dependent hydrolase